MRPDQTRLALTLTDGSLVIMGFVIRGFNPDGSVQFEREVSEESVRAECAKAGLALASWRHVTDAELPDRDYRNAWIDTGNGIGHDMGKARAIHRDKLRAERAPLLAELDVAYQRADERGDAQEKRRVATEKQRLRDITDDPRIDAAETVDALRALRMTRK